MYELSGLRLKATTLSTSVLAAGRTNHDTAVLALIARCGGLLNIMPAQITHIRALLHLTLNMGHKNVKDKWHMLSLTVVITRTVQETLMTESHW